jgi:hypothetical protein
MTGDIQMRELAKPSGPQSLPSQLRKARASMLGTDDEKLYWDCHEAAGEIEHLQRKVAELEAAIAKQACGVLQLFNCTRWNMDNYTTWLGGLLILAEDEKQAREIFRANERGKEPEMVDSVPGVYGTGEARLIYEDELR